MPSRKFYLIASLFCVTVALGITFANATEPHHIFSVQPGDVSHEIFDVPEVTIKQPANVALSQYQETICVNGVCYPASSFGPAVVPAAVSEPAAPAVTVAESRIFDAPPVYPAPMTSYGYTYSTPVTYGSSTGYSSSYAMPVSSYQAVTMSGGCTGYSSSYAASGRGLLGRMAARIRGRRAMRLQRRASRLMR